MNLGTIVEAAGAFAVTNIDTMVTLVAFFGQAAGRRGATFRVISGLYLGSGAILLTTMLIALLGDELLPAAALPYFGLVPIVLGLRAGFIVWRERRNRTDNALTETTTRPQGAAIWHVAAVSFSNGGDTIGLFVPIFAGATLDKVTVYTVVYLIGVAIWCAAGKFLTSHPIIVKAFTRWGHIVLPVVLIGIGLSILNNGGVFGHQSH